MLRNSNKAKLIPACLLALWLVAILGCQNSPPAVTSTANVSGTVTLDGEPVSGAAIVFIPVNLRDDNNKILNLAYGVTNQDGFFQLAYSDNNPDIIGTNYNVLITKSNSATPWPLALLPESIAKFSTFNESEELIPENYNVHSELYFDFNDSKENVVKDFKLSTLDPAL